MKILKTLSRYFLIGAIVFNFGLLAAAAQSSTESTGLGLINDRTKLNEQNAALEASSNLFTAGGSATGITDVIATIIQVALSLLGIIFLVLIVLSGYQWLTAGGNEDEVTKAQTRMKNAIIGLVIVLAAYAITVFVFTNLPFSGGVTGGNI